MTMENGPALWTEILKSVRGVYGSGIIAGGAVRDHFLGFTPKDIDVFVNVDSGEALVAGLGSLDERFLVTPLEVDLTEYEQNPDWVNEVTGVLDGRFFLTSDRGWFAPTVSVQVIGRPMDVFSGEALASRFDFGITRCWFDGTIHDTPEASSDRDAKVLTLLRTDTPEHVAASRVRALRFINSHPEFSFGGGWPESAGDWLEFAA